MKELSIEEKAKRYDEAIEELRGLLEGIHEEKCEIMEEDITDIFPELKESEGERIRNFLIDFIKVCGWTEKKDQGWPLREECIGWLEKQGEKNTTIEMKTPEESLGIDSDTYNKIVDECIYGEQKSAEFDDTNAKQMFIKALERVEEQNNKGYKLTDCDKNSWWEDFKTYTSCIVEQEPAWSEEDERMHRKLHNLIYSTPYCDSRKELSDWLKSLKDKLNDC